MQNLIKFLEEIEGVPFGLILGLMAVFALMQATGEFLELKGKIVPEFMKVRKYFKRRKEEKESMRKVPETLKKVETLLSNVEEHYSSDNISKRNKWMEWVNKQADVYDVSIAELKQTLIKLLVDNKRNYLLDFTSKAADMSYPMSKEQYQRFYTVHAEYEEILKENDMTNGQVDVAYDVANKSFAERLRNHAFIEDKQDYES